MYPYDRIDFSSGTLCNSMRTFEANELEKRVDEVLFYIWDPIGVSPEPFARWEYKSYVAEVLTTLSASDSVAPISNHLGAIVRNSMGLPPDKQNCDKVAELLLEHKNAITQGMA